LKETEVSPNILSLKILKVWSGRK